MKDAMTYDELLSVIAATKTRLQDAAAEANNITSQLADPGKKGLMNEFEYKDWKHRAIRARGFLIQEAGRLKSKLAGYNRQEAAMRHEMAEKRKSQALARRSELQAEHSRKIDGLNNPELVLIRRLYAGLARMYKLTEAEPTDIDKESLDLAQAYLINNGGFDL